MQHRVDQVLRRGVEGIIIERLSSCGNGRSRCSPVSMPEGARLTRRARGFSARKSPGPGMERSGSIDSSVPSIANPSTAQKRGCWLPVVRVAQQSRQHDGGSTPRLPECAELQSVRERLPGSLLIWLRRCATLCGDLLRLAGGQDDFPRQRHERGSSDSRGCEHEMEKPVGTFERPRQASCFWRIRSRERSSRWIARSSRRSASLLRGKVAKFLPFNAGRGGFGIGHHDGNG